MFQKPKRGVGSGAPSSTPGAVPAVGARAEVPLLPFRGGVPQGMDLAPAVLLRPQAAGMQDALDVEPLHWLVAVDALQIADEHRVVEPQPGAKGTRRGRGLGYEQP